AETLGNRHAYPTAISKQAGEFGIPAAQPTVGGWNRTTAVENLFGEGPHLLAQLQELGALQFNPRKEFIDLLHDLMPCLSARPILPISSRPALVPWPL